MTHFNEHSFKINNSIINCLLFTVRKRFMQIPAGRLLEHVLVIFTISPGMPCIFVSKVILTWMPISAIPTILMGQKCRNDHTAGLASFFRMNSAAMSRLLFNTGSESPMAGFTGKHNLAQYRSILEYFEKRTEPVVSGEESLKSLAVVEAA